MLAIASNGARAPIMCTIFWVA